MSSGYFKSMRNKCILDLRAQLKELPPFVAAFFTGMADTMQPRTRLAYARDLKIFFDYLTENELDFIGLKPIQITIEHMNKLTANSIQEYMEYLTYYLRERNGKETELSNEECGKSRKLASVRSLLSFLYKREKIDANPSEKVDFPKLHRKNITRLEVNEVAKLLDVVEDGSGLTEKQQQFHKQTAKRDLALISLLLGTGMRVSECVGVNIEDLDFETNGVAVTRKGGDESVLYFNEEVADALTAYLEEREDITAKEPDGGALFLSGQNRRINVRTVQNLVKKYAKIAAPLKKISPHKLRSTYGTNLYMESGDIYLVADALGHSDVNTTAKHYAQMVDERRRKAAKFVKLRD